MAGVMRLRCTACRNVSHIYEKEEMKQRIIDIVDEQFASADRNEIAREVERSYDSPLDGASVKQHIPTLAEGRIKSKIRNARRRE